MWMNATGMRLFFFFFRRQAYKSINYFSIAVWNWHHVTYYLLEYLMSIQSEKNQKKIYNVLCNRITMACARSIQLCPYWKTVFLEFMCRDISLCVWFSYVSVCARERARCCCTGQRKSDVLERAITALYLCLFVWMRNCLHKFKCREWKKKISQTHKTTWLHN